MKKALTVDRLKEIARYDPDNGLWTWLVANSPRVKVGGAAGNIDGDGYRRIKVDGKTYRSARLAWFWMTGEWPKAEVDHEDLDRSNDRWKNLRPATRSQNQRNIGVSSNNCLGVKGVGRSRSKKSPFHATIRVNGKRTHLGNFATVEAASAAFFAASEKHFGEFARGA